MREILSSVDQITFSEASDRCRFRTLVSAATGGEPDADNMTARLAVTIASIGGGPDPLPAEEMAAALIAMQRGQTVRLMSDRADARDRMRREILAAAMPVAGRA